MCVVFRHVWSKFQHVQRSGVEGKLLICGFAIVVTQFIWILVFINRADSENYGMLAMDIWYFS